LRGRFLFAPELTYAHFNTLVATGATIRTTRLSDQFTYTDSQEGYGNVAVPLFVVIEDASLRVVTAEDDLTPFPGQRLLSLIPAGVEQQTETSCMEPLGDAG
jgi:CPA1 family monovalent cation:H+ antiporter